MKQNKALFFLLILLLVLPVCACSDHPPKQNRESTPAGPVVIGKTVYPLKVRDFMEREVTIEKLPQRIVSLSPSTTETLFALQAGSRVVGVTNYDDYPPEVLDLPKVGNFKGPNIEAIVQQKPDLIFASDKTGKEQIEVLEKAGFTVVMLQARNIAQTMDSIRTIGQITDSQEQAHTIIQDMNNKISDIAAKTGSLPRIKTYYLVYASGNYTAGSDTFIDELITLSGGENVAGDMTGWVKFSLEKLVEINPPVIITSPHAGDLKSIVTLPGIKETKAVKEGNIHMISNENIVTRSSPRIVLGLEEMARYLHPEAFE